MGTTIITICLMLFGVMAVLKAFKYDSGKYKFKDESGKEIVEAKYDDVLVFMEGMCPVKIVATEEFYEPGK